MFPNLGSQYKFKRNRFGGTGVVNLAIDNHSDIKSQKTYLIFIKKM